MLECYVIWPIIVTHQGHKVWILIHLYGANYITLLPDFYSDQLIPQGQDLLVKNLTLYHPSKYF